MSSSNSSAPDPLAVLVDALLEETARWDRLAQEERDAASRLSEPPDLSGDMAVKAAQLRAWASARVLSAKAVRRVISQNAAQQARKGATTT